MNLKFYIAILISIYLQTYNTAFSGAVDKTYSLGLHAFAPNAGGQQVFAIRRATDTREISVFCNNYLKSGDYPLIGGIYSFRFSVCTQNCPIVAFVQTGVGVSSGGATLEFLWGFNLLWVARVDIATHFYLTTSRIVTWSYPLWIGISIPIFK